MAEIKKVIFQDSATVIIYDDGTKSIAKCEGTDEYNKLAGFLVAYLKKLIGKDKVRELINTYCYGEDIVFNPLYLYEKPKKEKKTEKQIAYEDAFVKFFVEMLSDEQPKNKPTKRYDTFYIYM